MTEQNKQTLGLANAAVISGDYEGFLSYCTEDTVWTFVGEQTLQGKEAVREYMAQTYQVPPQFEVERMIADGAFVTAFGKIKLKDTGGVMVSYDYCDVWRFKDGMLHELKAFVVAVNTKVDEPKGAETVIGSGFTYDENEHPTDESEPASHVVDEEIVDLPDLGKPDRP